MITDVMSAISNGYYARTSIAIDRGFKMTGIRSTSLFRKAARSPKCPGHKYRDSAVTLRSNRSKEEYLWHRI
jgi:hypothetical protein